MSRSTLTPADAQRIRMALATMTPREQAEFIRRLRGETDPQPPTGGAAPEQFWEHGAYVDGIGNLEFVQCTFGYDWTKKPITYYTVVGDPWAGGKNGSFAGQTTLNTEYGCWGIPGGLGHAVLNQYGPVQEDFIFQDCAWLAHPNPNDGSPSLMRWGVRAFAVRRGSYISCAFSRGMGAGTQVAMRAEAAGGHITPSGLHLYMQCAYIGNGDPKSERFGAFTISEHAPEGYDFKIADVEVEITDCSMVGGHLSYVDGNGTLAQSSRGIMANGRKRVAIERLNMDYPKPLSGWAIQLWNDPEVLLADSYVRNGLVELRNPEKVDITGNNGNAICRVWTGSTQDAYGNWVGGTLVHDAPISQPFQMGGR